MSLHELDREPIKPVHCACKLDICSPSTTSAKRLRTKLLSATRYVKNFFDLLNTPKHGSHSCLEKDEKVCLQTSPISYPPRLERSSFSKSYHLLKTKPQIFKTTIKLNLHYNLALLNHVLLSLIWPILWNFLPLLPHCTPYACPISTREPNTRNDFLLPHPLSGQQVCNTFGRGNKYPSHIHGMRPQRVYLYL